MNPFRPPPKPDSVCDTFALARRELSAALIERDDEIDLALTALLAGEHLLLVGPPGCGKSLLLDSLLSWAGGAKFAILFTKFTTPEECVGQVSLTALKADRYRRVTTGRLPEAEVCFIDEIWKASSAILKRGGMGREEAESRDIETLLVSITKNISGRANTARPRRGRRSRTASAHLLSSGL